MTLSALIVDAKYVSIDIEKVVALGYEMRFGGKKAYEVLKSPSRTAGLVYNVPIQKLLETVRQSSENMF